MNRILLGIMEWNNRQAARCMSAFMREYPEAALHYKC